MSTAAESRRRVNLRAPITGLILVLMVTLGGYYGWQAAFGESTTPTVIAGPTCSTSATTAPTTPVTPVPTGSTTAPVAPPPATTPSTPAGLFLLPSDVTVNVYNATARRGLAVNTAAILKDRGFVVPEFDNDPLEETILEVAKIRAAAVDQPEVLLLIQHIPGATVVADGRTTRTIDLVLGDAFTALGSEATVTPVPIASRPC